MLNRILKSDHFKLDLGGDPRYCTAFKKVQGYPDKKGVTTFFNLVLPPSSMIKELEIKRGVLPIISES